MAPRYPAVLLMEGELRKWFFSHQMWKILILKLLDSRLARVVWKDLCTHLDLHWVAPSNFPPQSQNGGAAKPQDETKVFICGSAVFDWEAVFLELEGSGVGERERMGLDNLLQHNGGSSEKPLLHLQLAALEVWATSLKLWLNCWCSSGEWGYKTKITFVEEESERNFIGDKSTLGWNQIWTRNGEIWNNTWLNFTINSWWMGPYTPYYTIHKLISPMDSTRSNYQRAASQHSILPRIQLRRECHNREFLL